MQTYSSTRLRAAILALTVLLPALLVLTRCAEDYTGADDGRIVIDSIAPTEGYPGSVVRVYGRGFAAVAADNQVYINGTAAKVSEPSSLSTLRITIPARATTGPVTITAAGTAGTGPVFTVFDAPHIDLAISYTEGKTLTIIGEHFSTDPRQVQVYFNSTQVNIFNAGYTNDGKPYVETPHPPADGDNPVSITIISAGISSVPYIYTATPWLSRPDYHLVYNGNTYQHTVVALSGNFFGRSADGNSIRFTRNGVIVNLPVKIVQWTPTYIEVEIVSESVTAYEVQVLVNGVVSNAETFPA